MSILSRIFNRNVISSTGRIAHQRRPRRLFEALEPRVMLSATPVITSAIATELGSTNNYSITINGTNLGTSAAYSGNGSGDLVVVDPGVFTGGQIGDGVGVNVTSWTNNQIVIDGLSGSYGVNGALISPADSLVISVTNPQTNVSAVTYQTVPGTPEITGVSVVPIVGTNNWNVTISGHGLGTQAAYVGDSADLVITDTGVGEAGHTGDAVTANVTSWNNDQVVINGFAGTYGQSGGWTLNGGDSLALSVSNPQDGLAAPAFNTAAPPVISSVSVAPLSVGSNNWTITINGSGFGTQNPYNGDSGVLAMEDYTANFNAGYTGDATTMNVSSWTNNQIVISGLTGSYGGGGAVLKGGDNLQFWLMNPQNNMAAQVVNEVAPPVISSVVMSPLSVGSNNWTITINGSGFGTQNPYNGDSGVLAMEDYTANFNAGYTGDATTMNVSSWTNNQIVISGLTGSYGGGGAVITSGDNLQFWLMNPQTGISAAVINTSA